MDFSPEYITDIEIDYPLQRHYVGSTVHLSLADIFPIWAKIVDVVTDVVDSQGNTRDAYQWRKQVYKLGAGWQDSSDGVDGYAPVPVGLTGPRQSPAFPSGETANIGDVVRLYQGDRDARTDPAVNYGLEWFYVTPKDKSVWLQIQHWLHYDPALFIGVPAKIVKWVPGAVTTGGRGPGSFQPVSSTIVRVTDPNGNRFRPDEIVRAQFVEHFVGSPGSADQYERTGLDAPHVNATGAQAQYPEEYGSLIGGFPSVREFIFRGPIYADHPQDISLPGSVRLHVGPAASGQRGILLGAPDTASGWLTQTGGTAGYDPTDPYREASWTQWARTGWTGFTYLATNTLVISNGSAPTYNPFGPIGTMPPDSAFGQWASGGTATMTAGSGQFALSVDGGQGFKIIAGGGTQGSVVWGSGVSSGTYLSYIINTATLRIQGFAPPVGLVPTLDSPGTAELGNAQTGYCWVGGPRVGGLTGIGNQSANISFPVNQGTIIIGANNFVQIGGVTVLGFGQFSQTKMVAQNYVFPPGANGGAGGGVPGANLNLPPGTPNSTGGFAFYNGIYVGGLEWLLGLGGNGSLRTPPNYPPPTPPFNYQPIEIKISPNPETWVRMETEDF